MTETTENTTEKEAQSATDATGESPLPAVVEAFVLQWGDMGNHWGVNRSIAQIHALLYLADAPMTAEDIATALSIARSNVSNSLKELLSWELIHRVPVRGERRDHYAAETDLWLISQRIAAGRKTRELDPAYRTLQACVSDAAADPGLSPTARQRLDDMFEFVSSVDRWYADMLSLPHPTLKALMKLGSRITAVLPAKRQKK